MGWVPDKPVRPGMVRVLEAGQGTAVPLEVWQLPSEHVGRFLGGIAAPLGLGQVQLEDGTWQHGFICEGWVASLPDGIEDITAHGGWVRYVQQQRYA